MPQITTDRGVLEYDDRGPREALCLVFIHGWTADRHRWDYQADQLGTTYRVVRVDLPGHGESPANDDYSINGLADIVLLLLVDLDLSDYVLVGHSMGGMVAMTIALTSPDELRALVLVDSIGKMLYSPWRALSISVAQLLPFRIFVSLNLRRAFGPEFPKAEINRYVRAAQELLPRTVRGYFRAMKSFDALGDLSKLELPIVLIHGIYDIQFNPEQMLKMAANIPGAEVRVLQTGHEAPIEDPEGVTSAIARFLERLVGVGMDATVR